MSFQFRTELVAENTIFRTQQAVWKERLSGKSVLEENTRTVASTTGGSQRLLCVGLYILSSERQASGTVSGLSARKWYWCRLHSSSTCLVRMFCIIIENHKCMWVIPCPFQWTILQCPSQYFCSFICIAENTECDLIIMRSVTTRKLKTSATVKKEDFIF